MTVRTLIAGLVGGLGLCAAGAACADVMFQPGLYEVRVSYPDDSAAVETTRECVSPAKVQEASLEHRLKQAVQDASCSFTQKNIGGGRFAIAGACNNDGFRSTLRQNGTYSPTSMTMEMTMTVHAPGNAPVGVRMLMSTRRIAAVCPAGTDRD